MKKLLALALIMVLALSLLTACGGGNSNTPSGGNSTTPPTSSEDNSPTPTESTAPENSSTPTPQGGGEEWPDNDFTQQIPNPAWGSLYKTSVIPDMLFSANYRTVSAEQAKEYAEELENVGFDTDLSVSDSDVVYSFGAKNADGYSVGITLTMDKGETTGELLLIVQKS